MNHVLVIAPKTVAEATWQREAAKWDNLKHLRFSTVLGSVSKRIRALNTPADIYIINRENIPGLIEKSGLPFDYDMVVITRRDSRKGG